MELQEASGSTSRDFDLIEAEHAAAIALRDDMRYPAALDKLTAGFAPDR